MLLLHMQIRRFFNKICDNYYVPQTKFGRHNVFAPFLILLLSFFRQKFIRDIARRLLNGNQWNFTGMLSTMSRCADYFRNFKNGRRCHGNGQNAKKNKNTKMIIAGYSPNRNWWNLIGTTSTSGGTGKAKKIGIGIGWTNFAAVARLHHFSSNNT